MSLNVEGAWNVIYWLMLFCHYVMLINDKYFMVVVLCITYNYFIIVILFINDNYFIIAIIYYLQHLFCYFSFII